MVPLPCDHDYGGSCEGQTIPEMAKREGTKRQTTMYKTLHRKIKIEQHERHWGEHQMLRKVFH
jgi:hypothetical protein